MKNKLTDLNNHLFEQLERLNDEDLVGEALEQEISRAKTMASISTQIILNGKLMLDAKKHSDEYGYNRKTSEMPELLMDSRNEKE